MSVKGTDLRLILQKIVWPTININVPPGILGEEKVAATTSQSELQSSDKDRESICKECFPVPSRLKNANDLTKGLAATVYYKLKQQIFCWAKQFEAAAHYGVNQKWLSELLHGRKYLGGKQCILRGMKENPEVIEDEEEEEDDEDGTKDTDKKTWKWE